MLQPKRTKYRRPQKGRCKGNAQRGNQLAFGSFGIKVWICRGEVYGKRDLAPNFSQEKANTRGNGGNGGRKFRNKKNK